MYKITITSKVKDSCGFQQAHYRIEHGGRKEGGKVFETRKQTIYNQPGYGLGWKTDFPDLKRSTLWKILSLSEGSVLNIDADGAEV